MLDINLGDRNSYPIADRLFELELYLVEAGACAEAVVQALVQAAATEAMTWQKQITREQTEEGLSLVQAEGMELYEPTKAELEAFRMAAQPSFDKWSERVGLELVDLFQSTKLSAN